MEEIGSNVTFPFTKSSTQCSFSISSPSRTGKEEGERNKALTGKQRKREGKKNELVIKETGISSGLMGHLG